MCGLACLFAFSRAAPPVQEDELTRMRDRMTARGPVRDWLIRDRLMRDAAPTAERGLRGWAKYVYAAQC